MKIIILAAALIWAFTGCSAIRPAGGEPVKEDTGIKNAHTEEVRPLTKKEKIISKDEKKTAPADKISFIISDLDVTEKSNGVMISFKYRGDDPKSNISTFFSGDNFFNISFYKGKFSETLKNYVYNRAVVSSVKFFEFKESVQITVRLKKDFSSSSVLTEDGRIIISVYN